MYSPGSTASRGGDVHVYLMATPCSGKTVYACEHPVYRGVQVVDFARELEAGGRAHAWWRRAAGALGVRIRPRTVLDGLGAAERLDAWFGRARTRLMDASGPLCLLGPPGVPDRERWPGVHFALVLLPQEEHLERARVRHERWPWDRSSRESAVRKHRAWAQEYAASHAIPVFGSFGEALDAVLGAEAGANEAAQRPAARA